MADFARDYADAGDQIRKALEAGDRNLAERLSHTLKGVAGNLSATALQAAAGALEQVLRDPEQREASGPLDAFDAALALTLEGARRLAVHPDSAAEGASLEVVETLMQELEQRLSRNDPRAEESLERLRARLRDPSLQPRLQALGDRLGAYDFRGAAEAFAVLHATLQRRTKGSG